MSTCRDVIASAFGLMGVAGPGEAATADELDLGLAALEALILELHESRGPLLEVDTSTDLIAGEDQRIRIEDGAQVVVTLPNSVPIVRAAILRDGAPWAGRCGQGSASPADGVWLRPPRDGARVEIVGTTQVLFFYRADVNTWQAAAPLPLDGPTPFSARYDRALAALLANALLGPLGVPPDPVLVTRIARANATLLLRPGTAREPLRLAVV